MISALNQNGNLQRQANEALREAVPNYDNRPTKFALKLLSYVIKLGSFVEDNASATGKKKK